MKAYDWHCRATERGFAAPDDPFLSPNDWGLLAARARGTLAVLPNPSFKGDGGQTRNDATLESFAPCSDLASLYWELKKWCEQVYTTAVKIKRCEWCHDPFGPNTPPRATKYCSPACRNASDIAKSNQRHIDIRKDPNRVPTPHQQRKKGATART